MEGFIQAILAQKALFSHMSYVFLVLSMTMNNIRALRIFAICSGLAAMSNSMWNYAPVNLFWETLFVLTNVVQLVISAVRNRRAKFNADETAFYLHVVPLLEPAQAHALLKHGRMVEAEDGAVLTRQGEMVRDLAFLCGGVVEIRVDGKLVAECAVNQLIGEISFSSGKPATATAVARGPVRYLAFDRDGLKKFLRTRPEIARALDRSYHRNLEDKLRKTSETVAALTRVER